MGEVQMLMSGLAFVESPRWHDRRLWFSQWVGSPGGRWYRFPNSIVVTLDNRTLIVAESYAKKLTAFDVAADGSASNRPVWADLNEGVS